MVSNVGDMLNAAQRARLLAMQKTARQLDVASLRLASGLKVNSAIDNPQNFFLARSLRNRAGDLERLLDGIGQNIRVIQEADSGIRASLKLLDLAESFLEDIVRRYNAGELDTANGLAPNETMVTFGSPADLLVYDAGQDVPASGAITVSGSNEVSFQGSYWRRRAINYTVTPQTVLTFEFRSGLQPEIAAIGFDNDLNFGNDNDRFFVYGSQTTGLNYSAAAGTYDYSGSGAWETIEIPIGTYFLGNYNNITFINDDDAAPFGDSNYRNIILREGAKQQAVDLIQFREEYRKIIGSYEDLVKDAEYRGINLLDGDDMTSVFSADRRSTLVTEGIDATSKGLGLDVDSFRRIEDIYTKLDQVRTARETLRGYGRKIATDLNIIKIREEFTRGQIITSRAGADELTVADQNEEGANLLALQTRQQLQAIMLALRPANILSILT